MPEERTRRRITVNGIVQGVGFRPFVYSLAQKHGLSGFVENASSGVRIEVEGRSKDLDCFAAALGRDFPPQALLSTISAISIPSTNDCRFSINLSRKSGSVDTLISPDIAVCNGCLTEMFDPADRRYRYPFINCTNCGPRHTIIENIPYDRPYTAMRGFKMCAYCQAEYDDPGDRRFHAQPNACPVCGPRLTLYGAEREIVAGAEAAVGLVADFLKKGKIVALKGLGGFHLAVDATNEEAVRVLRLRKAREGKPLAVMVRDILMAKSFCLIKEIERQVLLSSAKPILLARKRAGQGLAPSVAGGSTLLGLMLPYTPLQHLLFEQLDIPLVMTSANLSDEPICKDDDEVFKHLTGVADYFLSHDRDIYLRSDDSVVSCLAGNKARVIRRSRGYAPAPIPVKDDGPQVLAVGGELKNAICLLKGKQAFLGQHVGDVKNLETYGFFQETIAHLCRIFEGKPELIVYDQHPDYLPSRWAVAQGEVPTLAVQHHHAHLASCLAENRVNGPVIALVLDGTGYGLDRTIWGGEILVGDYRFFDRYACLEPMPLPGGDAAIKAPWRTAVAYLHETFDGRLPDLPFLNDHDFGPVQEMVSKNLNSPRTSSCGRLFDAVAAMIGGCQEIKYEAQAAIELMQSASCLAERPYICDIEDQGGLRMIMVRSIIKGVAGDVASGVAPTRISGRFHRTLVEVLVEEVTRAARELGIKTVALSGGVFNNYLLFNGLITEFGRTGLNVLSHSSVPTGDGGIALGQAMIGRYHLLG
ncbi:MAG: carbamoyltransferase HypF [Proteobacteria bacterium]|nr:carbamoyltransferase HypF [Pseudomonadota bacterium]MBU1717042.1 carbamoyltransferase HypF [Pseudomonadota bacterium]